MLVSILITTYNSEPLLARVIDSLLNQTYTNLEIVIVDDGSTDGTQNILNNYSKRDARIKVYYPGKVGRGKALNFGLSNLGQSDVINTSPLLRVIPQM